MLKIFFLICVFFAFFAISTNAQTYGHNTFSATLLLTNGQYGTGAVFGGKVWFRNEGNFKKMRVDYLDQNGNTFMRESFDFVSLDKWQVCGNTCKRATWTAAIPIFRAVSGSAPYNNPVACPTPDYPSYQACQTSCVGFSNTNAPQGILQLGFNSTNAPCLVRWAVQPGNSFGPEWHYTAYNPGANSPVDNKSPSSESTYTDVYVGKNCPEPTCDAKIDLALIVDQSGSIGNTNFNTVRNFLENIVKSLTMSADDSRVGIAYFDGQTCSEDQIDDAGNEQSCSGGCEVCGGEWELESYLSPSKSNIVKIIKDHPYPGGATCISCGVDVGRRILQQSVRPGVPQVLILLTDGQNNRRDRDDILKSSAQAVKNDGVTVVAVGVAGYVQSELETIASAKNRVYTVAQFDQLNSLIQQIVTPFCDPLPNIETCDFCSGLCACGADCTCPNSCDDNNVCTTDRCDEQPINQGGTAGKCEHTDATSSCPGYNQDQCLIYGCTKARGCYADPKPRPASPPDTFCRELKCEGGVWNLKLKSNICSGGDQCMKEYCSESGTPGCRTLNAADFNFGSTGSATDAVGNVITVQGCKPAPGDKTCVTYTCDPTTGVCTRNATGCQCLTDADCQGDNDGCTTDTCDADGQCQKQNIDCYSELSNGGCTQNQAFTGSSATGSAYVSGTRNATIGQDGVPFAAAPRTCDQLVCYANQPSTYTCQSLGSANGAYQCVRNQVNCSITACNTQHCTSKGTWTAGVANVDCSTNVPFSCDDNDACTTDACKSSWKFGDPNTQAARCNYTNIGGNCNDNDACTVNNCVPAYGCDFNTTVPPPTPATTHCTQQVCAAASGYSLQPTTAYQNCQSGKCTIRVCFDTNSTCTEFNRGDYSFDHSFTVNDAFGNPVVIRGCNRTEAEKVKNCTIYTCDETNGCVRDDSACECNVTADCNDGNGCTNEVCDANGKCIYTDVDCYSELSQGQCISTINSPTTTATTLPTNPTDAVGRAVWRGQNTTTNSMPDANNLPQAGIARTCADLACFNGERSEYSCQSIDNNNHRCVRQTTTCTKTTCKDTICRFEGNNWVNNQLVTSCNSVYEPNCTPTATQKCLSGKCNENWVRVDSQVEDINFRCTFTDISDSCNDNNECTDDSCNNSTGCVNTYNSPANNTCFRYDCTPSIGFQRVEQAASCDTNPDQCVVQYCNTTTPNTPLTGQCQTIDRRDLDFGTSVSFVDSLGQTRTAQGCKKPASEANFSCITYTCDASTGVCTRNTTTCRCFNDAGCNDNNGCTDDSCDTINNVCVNTPKDCYSLLSNAGCTINQNTNANDPAQNSDAVSWQIYNNRLVNQPVSDVLGNPEANGLPKVSNANGVITRNCAQLGCFDGLPSRYFCNSTGEDSFVCVRKTSPCPVDGCTTRLCAVQGTWSFGDVGAQSLDVACSFSQNVTCDDGNFCTDDFCQFNWTLGQPEADRCRSDQINATEVCDDGNFCTRDYCEEENTEGPLERCKHSLYSTEYLREKICTNGTSCQTPKCNFNKCTYSTIECTAPTLCFLYVCNDTTNGTCVETPTGTFTIDACGVCGGDGSSCPSEMSENQGPTVAVAAIVAGSIIGLFALCAAIFGLRKGWDKYKALAGEGASNVKNNKAYEKSGGGGQQRGNLGSAIGN